MKISVITVTYNAEAFLANTLNSILTQDCASFECVIVDGGSKDGTVDIIKHFEKRVSNREFVINSDSFRWISEPDSGLYDAMNKGMKLAKGDFFWFINAGDKIFDNGTIRKIMESYNDKCDVIYGQTLIIDQNENIVGERHKIAPKKLTKTSLLNGLVVCHQSILVKRNIAPEFDLSYKISADYDWVCKVLAVSVENIYIDGYLSRFMQSGISSIHKKQSLKERFYIMKKHFGIKKCVIAHFKILCNLFIQKIHR